MNETSDDGAAMTGALGAKSQPANVTRAGRVRSRIRPMLVYAATAGIVIGGVVALGWYALYLAAMRMYQVDEACNVYVATLLSLGAETNGGADLFQILLSGLMLHGARAEELFSSARLLGVVVFWTNWILLATATGERLFSRRWLVALFGAATLAPLWDYGFEARHDNLLLSGILFVWSLVRFGKPGLTVCALLGASVVAFQFVAIKAFVYTVPIAMLYLSCPPPGQRLPRWKMIAACAAGAIGGLLVVRLVFHLAGVGDDYLRHVAGVPSVPGITTRFWPWDYALPRLLTQTPLLLVLVVSAAIAYLPRIVRDRHSWLNWNGAWPELFLFLVALAALIINPNPYPYNLLHLVPYAFLLAFRYGTILWEKIGNQSAIYPVVGAALLFCHLVPFGIATRRHLDRPNLRQEQLMDLAEHLTDPNKDPVFDGIGIVPTRPIIDPRAFIHGQTIRAMVRGPEPQFRHMLAARPAAVIIMSYRTEWLPPEDHEFIRERYVALSDEFWVLGKVLPPGGGTIEIVHPGRYRISALPSSGILGTYPEGLAEIMEAAGSPRTETPLAGTLNGAPLTGQPVELEVGTHELAITSEGEVAVVWLGPRLDRLPNLGRGDRRRLFVNWY